MVNPSKNVIYIFSICFLCLCTCCLIFGYLICTDKTIYANTQVPEISLKNPGFVTCYDLNNNIDVSKQTLFSIMLYGEQIIQKPQINNNKKNKSCIRYFLGTDRYGRDVYSRLIIGVRYTLIVSSVAVLFSLIIGICLGLLAGYFGGKTDQLISLIISLFWSLPTILLAFVILMSFGRNMISIFISIGLTMWGDVARLVRGLVIYYKEQHFVQACKAMGFSHLRVMFFHILPNISGPIWIQASSNFALAILLESGLSFLGMGLQPPIPTLGNILQEQYSLAFSGKIIQAIIPSIVVVLLILSFQIITNHFRDRTDIKLNRN